MPYKTVRPNILVALQFNAQCNRKDALMNASEMYKFLLLLFFFNKTVLCAPDIKIIESGSSNVCNDFVMLGDNYQTVKFQVTGSNADYVVNADGPVLMNLKTDSIICGLKNPIDECIFSSFQGYSCFCEEISATEYHLTLNSTEDKPHEAFGVYMKWTKMGDKSIFMTSSNYTIKEVKDETCEPTTGPPEDKKDDLNIGLIVGVAVMAACCLLGVLCYCYFKERPESVVEHKMTERHDAYEISKGGNSQKRDSFSSAGTQPSMRYTKTVGSPVDLKQSSKI